MKKTLLLSVLIAAGLCFSGMQAKWFSGIQAKWFSGTQAKWEEIKYGGDFVPYENKIAIAQNKLWSIAKKKDTEKGVYLVEFDWNKKSWVKRAIIDKNSEDFGGAITVAKDGAVFVFFPKTITNKYLKFIRSSMRSDDKGAPKKFKGTAHTKPQLFRYCGGAFKKMYEFKDLKGQIDSIAAKSKNEVFFVRSAKKFTKNASGEFEVRPETFIEKWNGKSIYRIGGEPFGASQISIGADGSLYTAGSFMFMSLGTQKNKSNKPSTKNVVLMWNGKKWLSAGIEIEPKKLIDGLAVVGKNNVWFQLLYKMGESEFYQWDGKKLISRGKLKAKGKDRISFSSNIVAAPGIVIVSTSDGKLYQWFSGEIIKAKAAK